MKKKYMLMGIAAVLILATMVGGTLAAFNTKSEKTSANISIKSVGVTVIQDEPTALGDKAQKDASAIVPGSRIEMPRTVQNNIADGYDVYVKVVIYHTWEKEDNHLVDADEADVIYVNAGESEQSLYEAAHPDESSSADGKVNDWIVQYADDEQIILYYTKPVAPNQTTSNFMDGICFKETMGNDFANATYTLEYQVTAVQANNAKDAIAAELGVFPEFDENGNIISVSETR